MSITPLRPSLPPPDPDAACECLKAARARFLSAVHAELAIVHIHGERADAVRDWLQAAEDTVHDYLDDEIAAAQVAADEAAAEAEGVDEAAHIAAERGQHRAASGVQWGRR